MIGKFFTTLFRGRPVDVPGSERIAEGESRKIDVGDVAAGGTQIILCRVEGRLHALDSLCPHQRGRIQPGRLVEGKFALCPLHHYLFEPRTGKPVRGACRPATTYKVVEKDGSATVYV
jgi:nitrite reductase/ring-hydroxylating ferredoxin subunit